MAHRGLPFRLQITSWSADTCLAFLECFTEPKTPSPLAKVRVGVFLRRLTEDDQYAQVKVDGEDPMLDTDEVYTKPDLPHVGRQLFIRQSVNLEKEKY